MSERQTSRHVIPRREPPASTRRSNGRQLSKVLRKDPPWLAELILRATEQDRCARSFTASKFDDSFQSDCEAFGIFRARWFYWEDTLLKTWPMVRLLMMGCGATSILAALFGRQLFS